MRRLAFPYPTLTNPFCFFTSFLERLVPFGLGALLRRSRSPRRLNQALIDLDGAWGGGEATNGAMELATAPGSAKHGTESIMTFKTVRQVVEWRLCLGCGACAYICPEQKIRLVDFAEEGIRPVVETDNCGSCTLCLDVCPAYENDHTAINSRRGLSEELKESCGPVLEIWEGHAI